MKNLNSHNKSIPILAMTDGIHVSVTYESRCSYIIRLTNGFTHKWKLKCDSQNMDSHINFSIQKDSLMDSHRVYILNSKRDSLSKMWVACKKSGRITHRHITPGRWSLFDCTESHVHWHVHKSPFSRRRKQKWRQWDSESALPLRYSRCTNTMLKLKQSNQANELINNIA